MSDHSLPKSIDPFKYADQSKVLEGSLSVHLLDRAVEMLAGSQGSIAVRLEFGRDEQNIRVLKGTLSTRVALECQRCLEAVEKDIHSEFALGIVLSDEQAKHLPKDYEPLLVESDKVDLFEVIEEELILSLPMFAYHDACSAHDESGKSERIEHNEQESEPKRPNPFSVLSDLKLKK
ncbi:MAG: YceD family protein [Oleiphilaceae bacterium]|nr:YceD family protein [Oleiphilaceae bacterium]